ncbi:MAG: class I SAM-dependent methyltransferase [Anaerolineales bacterium]|jgi:ubiquinone/menaquinone biosynthesis C-methylase UbiE
MKDFYTAFYSAVELSQAHHVFCERVFGMDLCQHGFANLEQLELLLKVSQLGRRQRALDLGCGNGMITEYISDCTGAHITGLDYIPPAISQALHRTATKSDRLAFIVGDINQLELPRSAFDVILSIDSMYFSKDYTATLRELKFALRPSGQMGILYSYGREPWVPKDKFPKETLPPHKTPLAESLRANDLTFRTWDLTPQDYELAQRRKEVLTELKQQFEVEGTLFIYENRLGDAKGVCQAIEQGLHARYLYHVQLAKPD